MKTIADELHEHPFFAKLPIEVSQLIAGCGRNVVFKPETVIAKEGSDANNFYVIRRGRVALQVHATPAGTALLQTLDDGDILGWSWLFPPYRWSVEAKAMQDVHAIQLDGKCLRDKCDSDPAMGYLLMKRFSHIISQRLETTQLQLLDLYGKVNH